MSKYSIVVPVFNEETLINESYLRLKQVMDKVNEEYEFIFINDGSTDASATYLKSICSKDSHVKLVDFSRNFGHQVAITAGLDCADGDAVIMIDADLQDPPEVILEMIKKWKEGYEVVYGKRLKRKGETIFKKISAYLFYRLLKYLTKYDIPVDTGDFRLIDRRVCNAMRNLCEKGRYVRGLISWVGFKQTFVLYVREERISGETKYPLSKMIQFALDAITAFSYRPLRIATYLGFIFSGLSFLYFLFVIYEKLFTSKTILGWTSLIAINSFMNGVVLIILGITGEYIGRIYEETKSRPLYIIREKIGFKEN